MSEHRYRIRYSVEEGRFATPKATTRVNKNVNVSPSKYGYADQLIMVSLLHCEHGNIDGKNPLFLSTISPTDEGCSLGDLELLRDLVNAEIAKRLERN